MVGPAPQRAAVAHLQARIGLSEQRAIRSSEPTEQCVRYRFRWPPDTEIGARLRELANERQRFGCRRLFILLRRKGERCGINRLNREEGLTARANAAPPPKAWGVRNPGGDARPNTRCGRSTS